MRTIALLILFFLTSCRKTYKYIEVIEDHRASGDKSLKYMAAKVIDADSDSAAYCKAFQNFCISQRSTNEVEKELGKVTITPVDFILYNSEKVDIKDKVSFAGKEQREKQIMEMVSSLKVSKK